MLLLLIFIMCFDYSRTIVQSTGAQASVRISSIRTSTVVYSRLFVCKGVLRTITVFIFTIEKSDNRTKPVWL